MERPITQKKKKTHAEKLLAWYDENRRDLPWRARSEEIVDPYKVWLSEIMLQQTTVKAVVPYFQKFLRAWPEVTALAKADLNDILRAWAGLGYYSRARNLHKAARLIVDEWDGKFPETEEELATLPGVGQYTSAAIAAIAFNRPATVVDGNVERVIARLHAIKTPLPTAKPELRKAASKLTPKNRPGDYCQAMMDLGATICTPKTPLCLLCPLTKSCKAQQQGIAGKLPYRIKKAERPTRHGAAFVALRADDQVLLRVRPENGLLGGMSEVPGTSWQEQIPSEQEVLNAAPVKARWQQVEGLVTHTFTHFHLQLTVYRSNVGKRPTVRKTANPDSCYWTPRSNLDSEALPSAMRKVLAHALKS